MLLSSPSVLSASPVLSAPSVLCTPLSISRPFNISSPHAMAMYLAGLIPIRRHKPQASGWRSIAILALWVGMALGGVVISGKALAGEVVVTRSSVPFDAFAVRDAMLKDHEWQALIKHQQQWQILQALPIGCIVVLTPYRSFVCGSHTYRPYVYQQREVYILIDVRTPREVGNGQRD